jgi:hypothetical protein
MAKKYTQLLQETVLAATQREVGAGNPISVTVDQEAFSEDSSHPAIILDGSAGAESSNLLLKIRETGNWVQVPDDAGNAFTFSANRQVAAILVPGEYGIEKAATTAGNYSVYTQY